MLEKKKEKIERKKGLGLETQWQSEDSSLVGAKFTKISFANFIDLGAVCFSTFCSKLNSFQHSAFCCLFFKIFTDLLLKFLKKVMNEKSKFF